MRRSNQIYMDSVYVDMMKLAREQLNPEWKNGQVIILETWPGQYHHLAIPDYRDPVVRESLEDQLIEHLIDWKATRVLHCLCTMDGSCPDIPSWHLRSRLVEIDPRNLETELFLQGPEDCIRVRSFSSMLPPKKE